MDSEEPRPFPSFKNEIKMLEADTWVETRLKIIEEQCYGTFFTWVRPDLMEMCIAGLEEHGWIFIKPMDGHKYFLCFKHIELMVEEWINSIDRYTTFKQVHPKIIDKVVKITNHPLYTFMKVKENVIMITYKN
jgi:hypothetical protein